MLINLSISNYALINQLELKPSPHLNTITGETGAGKSIMLGAMGLLLGKRADSKVLLDRDKKCIVEGNFNISAYKLKNFFKENELDYFDETIIRREIAVSGKSRAFINDTPVTLDVLKQLSVNLIDIHSQHDTMLLGAGDTQLQIVDMYAQSQKAINEYQKQYHLYKEIEQTLSELKKDQAVQNEEYDFNKFQLDELVEANLLSNEEFEKIEQELKITENSEEIKKALTEITQIGSNSDASVLNVLNDVKNLLKSVSSFSDDLELLSERIGSSIIELDDIFSEVEQKQEQVEFDPLRIEIVRTKLDSINSLLHKHKLSTVEELITLKEELQSKVNSIAQFDDDLTQLEKELRGHKNLLNEKAEILSAKRSAIFTKFKVNVEHILKELGMPNAVFKIVKSTKNYSLNGADEIQLLFSANKGVEPQTLKQAASGGEFSRLMFTIKYLLASKIALPTIIFDEIDTGISGEIAIKMGKMMNRMAENHQVLTITHLPQVAALGNKHYFVFKDETKDRTYSQIKELEGEKRELEIAKMISGDNPSPIAFQNARELLSL